MKKSFYFILLIGLSIVLNSCSGNDEVVSTNQISPPDFLIGGTWVNPFDNHRFSFTEGNIVENTNLFSNSPIAEDFNYNQLFSSNDYIIEQIYAENFYSIRIMNTADTIQYINNTQFRLPLLTSFELLDNGQVVTQGAGLTNELFTRE